MKDSKKVANNQNKKKILLVTSGSCGGSERVILTFARLFLEHNFIVKILIISINGEKEIVNFIPMNIPYSIINVKRLRNSFFQILKSVYIEKPHFTLSSISIIGIYLIISSFFYKKTKIIVRQGFMPAYNLDGNPWFIKFFYPFAFKIIAQTNEMKNEMITNYHLKSEKIMVVNNPIDKTYIDLKILDISPYTNVDSINWVAIGRIARIKDYLTLIKAFEIICKKNGNNNLYILGAESDKVYANELKEYIISNNLSGNIYIEGFTENPYKYLINADCFVLSSISEGLPNVLLEALYLKIPVVATRCIPFIQQVVKEGINGFTVPIGNVEKLSEAMGKAISLKSTIKESYENNDYLKLVNFLNKTNEDTIDK